jgi:dienelactone hydrolase
VGHYTLPDGAGPHPAVILMPSCVGPWSNDARWAERFNSWGFAALRVESHKPRGGEHMCSPFSSIGMDDLAADIPMAIQWLRLKPDIDSSRIYVVGWSSGAGGLLLQLSSLSPKNTPAVVALYPPCRFVWPDSKKVPVRLLILAGDDDFMAGGCARMYKEEIASGRVTYVEYPDAGHLFDAEGEDSYQASAAADAANQVRQLLGVRQRSAP